MNCTWEEIKRLRREASGYGDEEMIDICDRALEYGDADALRECERAIELSRQPEFDLNDDYH